MTSTSNSQNDSSTHPVPPISVIMSVYNGQAHVREAIESILDQTYRDFEFIIIDDASTDLSSKIIENVIAERNDNRIIFIKNETNVGLTKSLNKGLSIARGTYIARTDSDDISLPNRLAVQKKFLDEHADIACVGSATIIINKDGISTGQKRPVSDPEVLRFYLLLKNQMSHSTVMFRKDVIMQHGGYNENIRYTQDYDLWSRLLEKNVKLSNIAEPLVKYRLLDSSITQGTSKQQAYEFAKATVYKNISRYISISTTNFETFIESLHRHRVYSLKQMFVVRKILNDFSEAFLEKECVSAESRKIIREYVERERAGALRWYAMQRLGILYQPLVRIKKLFQPK